MKPLQGQRILVTRPAAQAGKLAAMIAEHGGEAVLFPLIEVSAAADTAPLQRALAHLDDFQLAVFISPNAVAFSVPTLLAARPWPNTLQAAAIGPGTVAQLATCGIHSVLAPRERFDSEALLELPAFQPARIAGRKVLLLRGNGGRELLAETLSQRGALVEAVSCYHRSAPADASRLVSLLRNKALDALTVSSSEGLRTLLALLDTESQTCLAALPVFAPHQRIAEMAETLGLRRVILTRPADAGIIESLCAFNWLDHD